MSLYTLESDLLPWAPPKLKNPTKIEPAKTGFSKTVLAAGQDAILAPNAERNRGVEVRAGRNIQMIGRKIDLHGGTLTETPLQLREFSGHVFLEGCILDAAEQDLDTLNAGGSTKQPWTNIPVVTLQKMLLLGGNSEFADPIHADAFEPQQAMRRLEIARLTGVCGYQVLFLPAQKPQGPRYLSEVNLKYYPGTGHGYLLWLLSAGSGLSKEGWGTPVCNPVPTYLDNVYLDPGNSGRPLSELAFPGPGAEGEIDGEMHLIGAESDDGWESCYWPAITQIHGRAYRGAPPGGDYVVASEVGNGYAAKGYRGGTDFATFTGL